MIADEIISEIRSRADIVAVIGRHVTLKKSGTSFKGLCPFHGEKTPSFNVLPAKGFFHCFGCQKNGDVFTFVMELEGKSFVEAAESLGAQFGVEVPRVEESPELRRTRGERVAMLDINRAAMTFFREVLADPARGEPGRAYLAKRGVTTDTADAFQLGYAPGEWDGLANHLKAKRVDLELAAKLGLIRPRPRTGGYYDLFRERLVCPVVVPGGEIVAFSARVAGSISTLAAPSPDGSEPPKYINSPESAVYKKSKELFGLAQASKTMQQNGRAVLVEGNFDVITLHQAGFTEVVAPLGTALTPEQVGKLKRLTERVVLLYDGDRAGYKATMHALHTCVEAEVEVLVAARPGHARSGGAGMLADGVDPDSLVAGGGAPQLREAIDRAQGGIEFFCFEVWGKHRANADARTRALEEAARLIGRIANPIKRDLVIDTLAKALDVQVGVVRNAVARAAGKPSAGPTGRFSDAPEAPAPPVAPAPREELEVLKLVADHPSLIATPEADKAFWLLTDARLRDIYTAARPGRNVLELAPLHLPTSIAQEVLSGKYADAKDPLGQLVAMTRDLETRKAKLDRAALQKIAVEAERRGDREIARLMAQYIVAETKGDHELAAKLADEISTKRKKAE